MSRVQIDAQSWGTVWDTFGNGQAGLTVDLKLAGTATDATHYSALTAGTSSTADLVTDASGLLKASGSSAARFIDEGAYDMTVDGLTRRVEAAAGTLVSSATWDPAATAATQGAMVTTTIAVVGAAVGDFVAVQHSSIAAATAAHLDGFVSATDVVTVRIINNGAAAVDLASGTLKVRVSK